MGGPVFQKILNIRVRVRAEYPPWFGIESFWPKNNMFPHTIYFDSCLEPFLQNAAIRLSKISRRARNKCKLELCAVVWKNCLQFFSYNNIFAKSAFLYGSKKGLIILIFCMDPVKLIKVKAFSMGIIPVILWNIYPL